MTRCPTCGGARLAWTRLDIIEALLRYATRHGRPPTSTEWNHGAHWHPSATTVKYRFGTWQAAVDAAGLSPRVSMNRQTQWDRDSCIRAIRAWTKEHGVQPRANDWSTFHPDRPSKNVIRQRFGKWNHALVAAGLEPHRRTRALAS